jgi:hypothetical protein
MNMRGIGAVTAGVDIKQTLCLAWFLEDMPPRSPL